MAEFGSSKAAATKGKKKKDSAGVAAAKWGVMIGVAVVVFGGVFFLANALL